MEEVNEGFPREMVLQLKCEGLIGSNKKARRRKNAQVEGSLRTHYVCAYV